MCDCQGNQSLEHLLNMSLSLSRSFSPFVGLKKIRNPERMVRIAVGYTGHTPPKSDDTDANSKRHTNALHTVCVCARTLSVAQGDSGSKYKSLLAE